MMSWGHMKADPTDGYNPHKKDHEGYYVGTNQDPDHKPEGATDDNPDSVAAKDRDGDAGAEGEGEGEEGGKDGEKDLPTEKVSVLQPLSYLRRADNNFFGGRTTFYTQLESQIKGADDEDDVVDGQTEADNAAPGDNAAGNDSDIEPEKVSLLDPEAYELRSEMNSPNMRTTWYGSTRGVEETSDLLQMRKKHRKHKKSKETPAAASASAAPAGEKPKASVPPPEKVQVLDPEAYQHEANNNKPNKRTTFYHKKNGVKK